MVGAHPGFLSMKYILLVPPEWDASPSQGYPTPSSKKCVSGTHLYNWVRRDKVELSSLSRETTRQARFYPRPPHLEFEASTTWPHMCLRNEVLPVILLQIVIVNHETHLVKNHESQS